MQLKDELDLGGVAKAAVEGHGATGDGDDGPSPFVGVRLVVQRWRDKKLECIKNKYCDYLLK